MKRFMALAGVLFAGSLALAGEVIVIDNPNPADYQLNEGERLIMVVPSVDAASRYIPPEQAFGAQPRQPAVRPAYPAAARPAPRMTPPPQRPLPAGPAAARPAPRRDAVRTAEVANETARRNPGEKREPVAQDERIPWWKGGLWRNNDNDAPANEENPAPPVRRASPSEEGYSDPLAIRRAPSPSDFGDADMWGAPPPARGQQQYAGGYDPYAPPSYGTAQGGYDPYAPPPQQGYDPYAQAPYPPQQPVQGPPQVPYGYDPYVTAPAQQPVYDPYAPQMAGYPPVQGGYPTQGGYVSEPFTDPNAPLGAYLDAAYGSVPAIDAATGAPITQYPPAAGGYAADPYAAAPYGAAPVADPYAAGYPAGAPAGGMTGDPFASFSPAAPAPSYDASLSGEPSGGPQFENAVRMVKENRFTEAKAVLAAETQRNPGNAAAWRWLADCHYNLLELDDAIRAYQRSLDQDQGDYYALRGQGFSYLHRGHEYWRRMQEEVAQNRKEAAAATFALAHDDYKKALEMLGLCLRRAPNDGEAIYGEAMAAEGASRKLYSNAISYLKLGPEQRERAELFAENCLTVINKGIEQSRARSRQVPGDSGPRALLGGLYLRKATLYHQLDKNDLALIELRNARDAQRSILDEIDKNNATALRANQEIESLWNQWGGNS